MSKLTAIALCFLLSFSGYAAENEVELSDIGIFNATVPADKFTDSMLELRTHKLEHHKMMGHVTMGLMAASFITAIIGRKGIDDDRAARGGGKSTKDASNMNLHMGVSALTLASYFTTAYFSLSAPKPSDFESSTARHWHKGLAWIHGTAMVLAPVLGYLAFKDYHDGKDPSGLAKLHRPLMMAGFGAFAASYTIAVYNW